MVYNLKDIYHLLKKHCVSFRMLEIKDCFHLVNT